MGRKYNSTLANSPLRVIYSTRREFLAACGTATGAFWLAGCGGGSGGVATTAPGAPDNRVIRIRGHILLPPGFAGKVSSLTVVAPNATPVAADGTFAFDNYGNRPNLIAVTDSAGNLILLGYSNPASGKPAEVSAKMTAAALLFCSLDAYTLPSLDQRSALSLIISNAATATLAGVVAGMIAANPLALTNQDPTILAALVDAKTAFGAGSPTPRLVSSLSSSKNHSDLPALSTPNTRHTARESGTNEAVQILVTPLSGQAIQSGLIVQATNDKKGIQVTNTYRRHVLVYVQQTEYTDANPDGTPGTVHPYKQDEAAGVFPKDWVSATHRLTGLIGGAIDVGTNNGSYQPVNAEPVELTLSPAAAVKAKYHVIVVGPGITGSDQQPSAGLQPYRAGADTAINITYFLEEVLPVIANLMDLEFRPLSNLTAKMVEPIETIVHLLLDIPEFLAAYHEQEFKKMLTVALSALANNTQVRTVLLNNLRDFLALAAIDSAEYGLFINPLNAGKWLSRLNVITWVTDKAIEVGDLAAIKSDVQASRWFEEWDVELFKPVLTLSPLTSHAIHGGRTRLTATVGGAGGQSLVYVWETGSQLTEINDNAGEIGTQISTSKNIVDFVPKQIALGTITVTVTAYIVATGGNTKVGTAQASITIDDKSLTEPGYYVTEVADKGNGYSSVSATMVVPKVDKATGYLVHGDGFHDWAGGYPANVVDITIDPKNLGPYIYEDGGAYHCAISGSVPANKDIANTAAGFDSRFAGMKVVATVTL